MATAARTTTTYPTDGTEVGNFRAAYVNPLRAAFVSGGAIRASDINLLRGAIEAFSGHTHGAPDYRSIGEFGNNGPRTVLVANPRVSSAFSGAVVPASVTAGTSITASSVNDYVNACNATRNHTHPIEDDGQ
jgi:hypothetical protein